MVPQPLERRNALIESHLALRAAAVDFHHLKSQQLLGLKVVVERSLGDLRLVDDVLDAARVEAKCVKPVQGRVDYLFANAHRHWIDLIKTARCSWLMPVHRL